MQNRKMERSAGYAGIVGAILFAISGMILGAYPDTAASPMTIATYGATHQFALILSGWISVPAVVFILWFAFGLFDYIRGSQNADRALAQWGAAGAVIWAALNIASSAVGDAMGMRLPATDGTLGTLYVFDIILFAWGWGTFAMFSFAASNTARRQGLLPGWINGLGFLVTIVDALYTLSVFAPTGGLSPAGIFGIIAGILSMIWVLIASIALLVSTKTT